MIWKHKPTLEELNSFRDRTIHGPLGIEITAIGDDWLEATMPVDKRTHQPAGLLHGGASVVLAESLGSLAAYLTVDQTKQACVGIEINASHLRAVRSGFVTGRVEPIRLGRTLQVWDIKIRNSKGETVSIVRLTAMITGRTK